MIPRARPNYGLADLLKAAPHSRDAGKYADRLADQLREILGLPHVLLTPSGRSALYILLKASRQGEVLIPSFTCSAVAEAATLAGKSIVFAEHGSQSYNHTADDIRPYLQNGRVYIATHQYGIAAPIDDLLNACQTAGVTIYEDIAAALGTRVNGRLAGTFGAACFGSFDTTKLINAPLKGGFLATADSTLFGHAEHVAKQELRTMSLLRKAVLLGSALALVSLRNPTLYGVFHRLNFGWRGRVTAETGKFETQPTPIYLDTFADWQAKVVLSQLERLDDVVRRRQMNYRRLRDGLRGLSTLTLPPEDSRAEWAPIRFPILCHNDKMYYYHRGVEKGVDFGFSFTTIAAPAAHQSAHTIAAQVLNLPFDAGLSSIELEKIVNVLTELEVAQDG